MTSNNILSIAPNLMPQTTLFVCQSCHNSEDRSSDHPADGTRLLEQLHTQCANSPQPDGLAFQSVGCLWTCDKPCTVAFSAPHKPTYLFTKLPADSETAAVLLQFSQLYSTSNTGNIPYKQFPQALQMASIAKIPQPTGSP